MLKNRKYLPWKVLLPGKSEKNGKNIVTLFCILIKIVFLQFIGINAENKKILEKIQRSTGGSGYENV